MLDNQLYKMLFVGLRSALDLRGIATYKFKKNFQPTQQGRPTPPTIYLRKFDDNRYGYRGVKQVWDSVAGKMVRQESQVIQSTFKAAVTQPVDPDDENQLTHSDALKFLASVMQSDDFIKYLRTFGAQVLRISDVKNIPIENDQGQFEDSPTFDVIITHTDTYLDNVPVITKYDFSTYRV